VRGFGKGARRIAPLFAEKKLSNLIVTKKIFTSQKLLIAELNSKFAGAFSQGTTITQVPNVSISNIIFTLFTQNIKSISHVFWRNNFFK
jgi:hypothetical protein